jgi:DNA-binding SARP family transcriptional activator
VYFVSIIRTKPISDWATRKSKSVFKYLLLNREKPVPKEILMEVFWPDSDETAARNNLNVTIYNLRQVFGKIDSSISYVLYQDDCYLLNPDLKLWFDYDVFREHYSKGGKLYKQAQFEAAVHEFQAAELVYRGELFEEDRYDDWLLPQREAAHQHYVQVLEHLIQDAFEQQQYMECITLCHKLLGVDACLEDTHRLLIRCYIEQGQNHLAIRQYYTCVQTLDDELGVLPSQDTVALYELIRTTLTKE